MSGVTRELRAPYKTFLTEDLLSLITSFPSSWDINQQSFLGCELSLERDAACGGSPEMNMSMKVNSWALTRLGFIWKRGGMVPGSIRGSPQHNMSLRCHGPAACLLSSIMKQWEMGLGAGGVKGYQQPRYLGGTICMARRGWGTPGRSWGTSWHGVGLDDL